MSYAELVNMLTKEVKRFLKLRDGASQAYRATLDEQVALTEKLCEFLSAEKGAANKELLERILDDTEWLASDWILNLPLELARHGMVDEAIRISRLYGELFETENFLGDLAVILAEAGRRDEALRQVESNIKRFPDKVWVVITAGDAMAALKENERSVELFYRAYEMSAPASYDRDGVLERLEPLLRELQRNDEADLLLEKDRESRKPVRPPLKPQIGRNEPCYCGSGKKHKKCCLRKDE